MIWKNKARIISIYFLLEERDFQWRVAIFASQYKVFGEYPKRFGHDLCEH